MPSRITLGAFVRAVTRNRLTLVAVLVALLFALPSLAYPFGRDQALHYYIGRDWLHGFLPYRDGFDIKPPAVFFLHGAAIALFGEGQGAIRIVDLACILAVGWLASSIVGTERRTSGMQTGLVILFAVVWYFTTFDYWDTAQPESWEGAALLAGWGAAVRIRRVTVAAAVSGALAGVAVLFKFPAAAIAVVAMTLVAIRAYREAAQARGLSVLRAAAAHAASALAVVGVTAVYFVARGGWEDMIDVLVRYMADYQLHFGHHPDGGASAAREFWLDHNLVAMGTLVGLLGVGLFASVRRGATREITSVLWSIVLIGAAVGSVVIQRRFFPYHWSVVTPFAVLAAAHGIRAIVRHSPRAGYAALLVALPGVLFACSGAWTSNADVRYATVTVRFWEYAAGRADRAQYLESFHGIHDYSYRDEELLGTWIRERAKPGDTLVVRGFEPAIYAVAGLRAPSRFAADHFLTDPQLTFHRELWTAEHESACASHRPRFIVTFSAADDDVRALLALGYARVGEVGPLVLLDRS